MFSSDTYEYSVTTNFLHKAAVSNNLGYVKALLDQGIDRYKEDSTGHIPFTHALVSGKEIDPEILKLLQPNDEYWTPKDSSLRKRMKLHQVLRSPRRVLELFLHCCKVDWKANDFDGRTPLHTLAMNKHYGVFDLFWSTEFHVNARDSAGDTALHFAARRHNKCAIEFLLKKGADVNIPNSDGMTPLLCTVESFSNDRCGPFYTAYSPIRQPFDFKECAMLLLENGANPQVVAIDRSEGEENLTSFFERLEECHTGSYRCHCFIDELKEAAVAHIAIDEMRGVPVQKPDRRKMNEYYKNCVQQLNLMKEEIMFGTVTVFQFLTEDEGKVAQYARSQDAVEWFEWFENSIEGYNTYYDYLLKKRYAKATKLNEQKNVAASTISQAIDLFDSDHIVTEKIVNYLGSEDLMMYS